MKNKTKVLIIACLIVCAIIPSFLILNNVFNSKKKPYYSINFPTALDSSISSDTELVYDIKQLQTQITDEEYYVYSNPKLADYSIVEKFGFDVDNYRLTQDGEERIYEAEGGDGKKDLWIDEFGCFTYHSGIPSPDIDMKLSVEECNKIAIDFLKKYGLYPNEILPTRSVNEAWNHTSEGSELLRIGINFYPKIADGKGTGKILVEINAKGEVVYVLYNLREYDSKQKTDLISLKKAIERFEKGNAYIEIENPSKKLYFENVTLTYYSQNFSKENLLMQPVYVFTGTSETVDGQTEPFAVTVQAN